MREIIIWVSCMVIGNSIGVSMAMMYSNLLIK